MGGLLAGFWSLLGGLFASPRGGASKGENPKWGRGGDKPLPRDWGKRGLAKWLRVYTP